MLSDLLAYICNPNVGVYHRMYNGERTLYYPKLLVVEFHNPQNYSQSGNVQNTGQNLYGYITSLSGWVNSN